MSPTRTEILEDLQRMLRRLSAREGVACLLSGGAGIGKTHLARQFVTTLPARAVALAGEAPPAGGPPLLPVCSALFSSRSGLAREAISIARRYQAAVPILNDHLRHRGARAVTRRAGRPTKAPPAEAIPSETHAFFALADVLRQLSAKRPIVLFIDDVQWLDDTSIGFLSFLLREAVPLLLLLSARTNGEESTALANLRIALGRVESTTRTYELPPLSPGEIPALAQSFLGQPLDCTPAELGWLHRTTAGSPKYLEEVLIDLRRQGELAGSRGALRFRDPPERLRVPPSLAALILSRLESTMAGDEAMERLVAYAAIWGVRFNARVIAQAAQLTAREANACLHRLAIMSGLVRSFGDGEWGFNHVLTREAVLGRFSDRARDLHHEVATVLAETPDNDPETIAHHFRAAHAWGPAARHFRLAAEKAYERFMFSAAFDAAREAEAMLERGGPQPDGAERLEISELIARSLVAGRRYHEAVDYIARVLPASQLAKHPALAHAFARAKLNLPDHRDHVEAAEVLKTAVRSLPRGADPSAAIPLLAEQIIAHDTLGEHRASQAAFRRAFAQAQASKATRWSIRLLRMTGMFWMPEDEITALEQAYRWARESGSTLEQAFCLNNLGSQHWYLQELRRAEECWSRSSKLLDGLRGYRKDVPRNNLGLLCLATGKPAEAAAHFRTALEGSLTYNDQLLIRTNAAVAEGMLNRLGPARESLEKLASDADAWGDTFHRDCIRYNLARVLLLSGDAAGAIAALRACPPRHWATDDLLVLGKRATLLIEAHAALGSIPEEALRKQRDDLARSRQPQAWLYRAQWEWCDIQFWQD